jgi:hypothetical protein
MTVWLSTGSPMLLQTLAPSAMLAQASVAAAVGLPFTNRKESP